jgi:CheY-like chemotaxis protein
LRDAIGTVYADPGEVQQTLLNLCLNARDAMPSGGTLLLSTDTVILTDAFWEPRFQIEPGRYVVIGVTDTGQGISAEVQPHIFEPFFTTKEVGKGTGLGLAMVYGVVQQHKGAIHVYSEPGKGTTFKIYLPSGGKNRQEAEAEEAMPAPCGRETILIAEDEPMVRSLAVRILEKRGYTVLVAADGEEALRLFKENRNAISLTLLDAIMPRLTGHEVYRHIKAEYPEARVLFASGYDSETAQSGFILQERLRLVEKPFDADTLLRTVREVLDEDTSCLPEATTTQ